MKSIRVQHKNISKQSDRFELGRFLYQDCHKYKLNNLIKKIKAGELGQPISDREEFIVAARDAFESFFERGISEKTIIIRLFSLAKFIQFLSERELSFDISKLKDNYFEYCEFLHEISYRKNNQALKEVSAYANAVSLGNVVSQILDIPRQGTLVKNTRLKYSKTRKPATTKETEKQNIEETFVFGCFLHELITTLTADAILGQQPIVRDIDNQALNIEKIKIVKGGRNLLNEDLIKKSKMPVDSIYKSNRWVLFNLRVQAEILMFASQTGMNPIQIYNLKRAKYDYKLLGEHYDVRTYKPRKGGEVLFKIFKSYRPLLQDHLDFINKFAPESQLLFPVFTRQGKGIETFYGAFRNLQDTLKEYKIPWIPPAQLRKTKINWLLRRSGDEGLTSAIAQHTQKILRDKYELPSQQRAMAEITKFWNSSDSDKISNAKVSTALGECNGIALAIDSKPNNVVEPNCVSPSGCLWCQNFRDINNFDYIWSVFSMRHLKIIEAALVFRSSESPSDVVIERLTEKIEWYRNSTAERKLWVEEAELRIAEGHFHPSWSPIIEFLG